MKFLTMLNPIKVINLLLSPKRLRIVFIRYFVLTNDARRERWIKKYSLKYPASNELLNHFQHSDRLKEQYSELEENGIAYFKQYLSCERIEKIKQKIKELPCNDPYFPQKYNFTYETADRNKVHVASFAREDLVHIQEIMEIANDINLLALSQRYLGCKPTITNINVWWSFAGRVMPVEAQNYHRDKDDVKFLKFFVYLTDVDKFSGPHVYVQKSKRHQAFRSPNEARHQDKQIEAKFPPSDILYLTGNAGDAFIEDTFGIHKGLLPEKSDRLLLQIEYSYEPLLAEKYTPQNIQNHTSYDPFINRLLLKRESK